MKNHDIGLLGRENKMCGISQVHCRSSRGWRGPSRPRRRNFAGQAKQKPTSSQDPGPPRSLTATAAGDLSGQKSEGSPFVLAVVLSLFVSSFPFPLGDDCAAVVDAHDDFEIATPQNERKTCSCCGAHSTSQQSVSNRAARHRRQ